MRSYTISSLLILTAAFLTLGSSRAEAAPGPSVNVSVNGYLPAPPGVVVRVDAGRPYYIEHERRVYIERERPRHHRSRHYRREHRHHQEHAHNQEHDRHGGR